MSENVPNTGSLTEEQQVALDALASGATKAQAAQLAGRTERTLNRWIADDPAFSAALQEIGDTAVKDAARRLKLLLQKAITAVETVLDDPSTSPTSKLRAFDLVAGHTSKLSEFVELSERITLLEDKLNAQAK